MLLLYQIISDDDTGTAFLPSFHIIGQRLVRRALGRNAVERGIGQTLAGKVASDLDIQRVFNFFLLLFFFAVADVQFADILRIFHGIFFLALG